MSTRYTYQTDVEWTGARHGVLHSPALPDIEIAAPPEFKGHDGMWTPEHLFVSSVATCFVTTFLAIAELSKLEFAEIAASAVGTLERVEGKGFLITEIVIRPRLVILDASDTDRALRILDKSEKNCLISNSINSAVRIEPEVIAARPSLEPEPDVVEA